MSAPNQTPPFAALILGAGVVAWVVALMIWTTDRQNTEERLLLTIGDTVAVLMFAGTTALVVGAILWAGGARRGRSS